jgi:endogenous inhibitor of DNA gyrase (YacG/DUF329 family)
MPEPLCVFCRRHAVDRAWRPFCSERCKLQDLARWADGTYRVAAEPIDDGDGDGDDDENLKSDL